MKINKLYGHNNDNYLDEDVPILCFDPWKITFFCYDILQVCTKSSGKFNFLHYFFYNITLLLRNNPWNWVYINLVFVAMKLNDVFHCMVSFLNVFASFHNYLSPSLAPVVAIMFQSHSFQYALYQTNEQFVGAHSRATCWIV